MTAAQRWTIFFVVLLMAWSIFNQVTQYRPIPTQSSSPCNGMSVGLRIGCVFMERKQWFVTTPNVGSIETARGGNYGNRKEA